MTISVCVNVRALLHVCVHTSVYMDVCVRVRLDVCPLYSTSAGVRISAYLSRYVYYADVNTEY